MESDSDHALIEKKQKKTETQIDHPRDWHQLVRCTGKKHPFKVVEMDQSKFFNYAKLLKTELQVKKKDETGNLFYWRDIREIMIDKNNLGVMYFKTGINESYRCLSFRKRGSLAKLIPELQYKGLVPITAKKKDNLMKLLPYISDVFWDFYTNLPTNQADDIHPDLESSDEDE
ncbi:unnamed protein product [Acanthoscelides obtectus]|uniref:Uncharacterized protein n=1 Tax=Acanthoscelides obtectus TaxID=200917 RepID=A0A9P0PX83_ACAOB|nr:unnamed protein product [Acanthoscelides obtectus]CAK1677845.1 hypothetical protein AOBTE_LOCUS31585 [Acanthoscelides obtectus]